MNANSNTILRKGERETQKTLDGMEPSQWMSTGPSGGSRLPSVPTLKQDDRSHSVTSVASTVLSTSSSQSSLQEMDECATTPICTSPQSACSPPDTVLLSKPSSFGIGFSRDVRHRVYGALIMMLLSWMSPLMFQDPISPNSIYIPGGGFSAFWFTIGRLESMSEAELASKDLYCYSSGCLTAVAAIANCSKIEVIDMAKASQQRWQTGEIGLYEIVQDFVDHLVDSDRFAHLPPSKFQNVHFITAKRTPGFFGGVEADIRQASSLEQLNEMLVQSAFIPYITGSSLWTQDSRTGDYHVDGAFSFPWHPRCAYTLGFPWSVPHLYLNVLNPNMPQYKAEILWDLGVEYGIH
mmetsp:Transcript_29980/g.44280  ORF Transcript_29980/g.44280 Transcript_29980/m.44280 type:complete len:351 (-) Transcript_29980:36-1088(-)